MSETQKEREIKRVRAVNCVRVKFAAFLTQAEGRKRQRERERDRDGGRRERWGEERDGRRE